MRVISDLVGTLRQSFFFGLATLTAVLTQERTYTFPDKDGTVAMLDDITGGGGASTLDVPASEALLAGELVNIHSSTVANARKANATDGEKPADGFVLANVSSAATANVRRSGELVTGLTGLTPGARYYLSTTAGAITTTPPSTSGNVVQYVGVATSTTSLFFAPEPPILLS